MRFKYSPAERNRLKPGESLPSANSGPILPAAVKVSLRADGAFVILRGDSKLTRGRAVYRVVLHRPLQSVSSSLHRQRLTNTMPQLEPLNPQRLVTILAHLLPPAYPLPPDLLSSAIKTRQLYLPPSVSNPSDDRYIAQRPHTTSDEEDPEELSRRLKAIADARLHAKDAEWSNEVQLQGEGNEIEVALYREAWNVRYRAMDGETVVAKLDLKNSSNPDEGVRILFFPESGEGEEDSARVESVGGDLAYRSQISMGDEWKLFDVKPLEECLAEESTPVHWASSPREALDALKGEGGEVGGEDQAEDDYWGGFSDDEKEPEEAPTKGLPPPTSGATSSLPAQSYTNPSPPPQPTAPTDTLSNLPATIVTKKVTISPFVSRFNTPSHHDDAYWSSYGGVEDGLKVSNPPSPRGVSRFSTPGVEGGYWGTGGETPISWSVRSEIAAERC